MIFEYIYYFKPNTLNTYNDLAFTVKPEILAVIRFALYISCKIGWFTIGNIRVLVRHLATYTPLQSIILIFMPRVLIQVLNIGG